MEGHPLGQAGSNLCPPLPPKPEGRVVRDEEPRTAVRHQPGNGFRGIPLRTLESQEDLVLIQGFKGGARMHLAASLQGKLIMTAP